MRADVRHRRTVAAESLEVVLSRAASEWRATFDAIESPIVMVDGEGRVTRLNRAAQKLAALRFDELVGRSLVAVDPGEPWQEASRLVEVVKSSRVNTSAQIRDVKGRSWEILASLAQSDAPANERIIILARDVSAVVQLEASLRRAEAVSSMGSLVAGVAHEVRNPLFAISALLDAMEARLGGSSETEKYLMALRGELDRLSRLMRDLLEYGKPAALELRIWEVGEVVASVVGACEPLATRSGVVLANRVPSRFARLRMDRGRIAQAVGNLVENAVQHSPQGGTVSIEGRTRHDGDKGWLELTVADLGPGFREVDLPSVFEPFFTRRRGGTGLGLSIVQRIVEAHGGRARVENAPGGGAVVMLSLPLEEPSVESR